MKRTIVNIGAILAAFLIGITINNACAKDSDSEQRELISELRQEINALKQRVARLERQSSSSGASGEFKVGELYFNRGGQVTNRRLRSEYNYQNEEMNGVYTYNYDSYGRYTGYTYSGASGSDQYEYVYDGKKRRDNRGEYEIVDYYE